MKINSIDIIIGGQFGSEGKGLVASDIATNYPYDTIVSVNSAQAGHTHYYKNEKVVLRFLPSGAVTGSNTDGRIVIANGSVLENKGFIDEIEDINSRFPELEIKKRLVVSAYASVITDEDVAWEKENLPWQNTGSTQKGIGAALSRRALRSGTIVKDSIQRTLLEHGITVAEDVTEFYNGRLLLEGSQGFGLSNHGRFYPKTTSRSTLSSAFLAYALLPPTKIRHIFGVYRTFPIRVAGESGELRDETTWEEIAKNAGYKDPITEITTVTKRVRRVGWFDDDLFLESMQQNGVNVPVFTFLNYLDAGVEHIDSYDGLSEPVKIWINERYKMVSNMVKDFGLSTNKYKCFWYRGE